MPTECSQDLFDFGTVEGRQVVGAFDGGQITSDAGALLLGQTNRAIGLVSRLAGCFQDGRDPAFAVHEVPAMLAPAHLRYRARLRGHQRSRSAAARSGARRARRQL